MIPKGLPFPISPFIATHGNFIDIRDYQNVEAARREIKAKIWPVVERLYVPFENGNLELMKKDGAQLTSGKVPKLLDEDNRAGWLMATLRHFLDFFVIDPDMANGPGRIAALAFKAHEAALRNFASQYVASGRMAALWKELNSVRRQFVDLYESFMPLLMVRRYRLKERQDITKFELSVNTFR